MRLTYTCSVCKKLNFLRYKEATRPDLQLKMGGNEVKVNCDNCGKFDKKHINRVTAVVDNKIIVLGIIASVVCTIALWNFLGAIAAFTFSIPILFWRHESEKAHEFNSYSIRRN